MKRFLTSMFLLSIVLTGCSKTDINQISSSIESNKQSLSLQTLSDEEVTKLYSISKDEVSESIVKTTYTDVDIMEYAVFHVKNKDALENVKSKVGSRAKVIQKKINDLQRTNTSKNFKPVIVTKNEYVFFCIGENSESLKTGFLNGFEKKQDKK
ncbi:DUF4358 domain-containing protein [Bacillus sp. AR18-7]|uniref:DUF4358 domain-containing protein n=1 Tax=Bacillus sp. AR18-7 TaxID=2217821 RepID=UPI0015D3F9C2|nr:DUF4358 domain-containing protein [Bacillus sp. AR18-7]